MAVSKRERQLLVVIIIIAVVIVNLFLFSKLRGPWQQKNTEFITKQRELTTKQGIIAHMPEWRQSYEALGRNLKQSERFETSTDVIKKVDEVATAAGILTQSKRTVKEEEHDVYHEWLVRYSFEATTEPLVKFLHGLQTASGFMTVDQLDVTTKAGSSGILRGEIQIRALAAKEGKPVS